jgi:hypothetical protein
MGTVTVVFPYVQVYILVGFGEDKSEEVVVNSFFWVGREEVIDLYVPSC